MSFFKKLFNIPIKEDKEIQRQEVDLSLDDLFVHNFLEKGGKFLYCLKKEEVVENLKNIFIENNWKETLLLEEDLSSLYKNIAIKTIKDINSKKPVLTGCEYLIANSGDIMFSSNQLKSTKIFEYPENFIVYATTSQLVKNTGEALAGIKYKSKENLPTNISAIKNYNINKSDDNLLNYGNSNSKNLYLPLLEDL